MHVSSEEMGGQQTVRPEPGSQQPLFESFAATGPGTTAAPISVGVTIAEGGMGIVKLAEQTALGRHVVVKTMRGDFAKSSAEHVLREAWATGALEHPNIVPVHDIRVDEVGAPVIVLKRIEGDSWDALMHNEELLRERFGVDDPLVWNLEILKQVSQAIRYAHNRNILHRDLKPDNVMIGEFGEVYVVDWGIALSLTEADEGPLPRARDASAMAGTPCYLAPEMLGDAPLDARTDIYLLGAVLYQILSGRPPHRPDSLATLMEDIQKSSPVIPEDAPPALAAICRKAMSAAPGDRFQDVSAFASALQAYLQTRGSQALAEEAAVQLAALEDCLAASEIDNHEVYRLFGAVRFGYETALETWQANQQARDELDRARTEMIEYELSRGHARAAHAILQELEAPPEALRGRVEESLAELMAEQEELARFRDDTDLAIGNRTRLFLTMLLGTIWTGLPLAEHALDIGFWHRNYEGMILSTLGLGALAGGLFYWARDSLTKTQFNRRISLCLGTLFPMQIVLFAGARMMELPYPLAEQLMVFLWATIAANAAATVEHRLLPSAIGYIAAFFVTVSLPEYRFLAMAAGNLTFLLNGMYIWQMPADELLHHRRQRRGSA